MRFLILLVFLFSTVAAFAQSAKTTVKVNFDPISTYANDELVSLEDKHKISYEFQWYCSDGRSDSISIKTHTVLHTRETAAYIPNVPLDRLCFYRYRAFMGNIPGNWPTTWYQKQFTVSDNTKILGTGRIESVIAL